MFKKFINNIYIFIIFINLFGYLNKSSLIILFIIYKNLKIYFYYTILHFDFKISLKIKDIEKTLFNFSKLLRQTLKI